MPLLDHSIFQIGSIHSVWPCSSPMRASAASAKSSWTIHSHG